MYRSGLMYVKSVTVFVFFLNFLIATVTEYMDLMLIFFLFLFQFRLRKACILHLSVSGIYQSCSHRPRPSHPAWWGHLQPGPLRAHTGPAVRIGDRR